MASVLNQRELMDRLMAERMGVPMPPPLPLPKVMVDKVAPLRAGPDPMQTAWDALLQGTPPSQAVGQMQRSSGMEALKSMGRSALEGAMTPDPSDFMNPVGMAVKGGSKAADAAFDVADDFINFSKMGLSDEGEAGLRDLINKYAQAPPEVPGALTHPKPVLPDASVREAAKKIDPQSLFLLEPPKPGSGGLNEATSLALRDSIKGRMGDLQRWTTEAAGATDEATKTIANARAAAVENDIAKLVKIQSGARAEAGRGLRVWRQMAEETTDPSFWLGRAAQKAGGHLPGDKALDLNAILKRIEDAPDDEAKSLAKLSLAKWMQQFEEHGVVDVALALRKAGLISGVKSHIRNVGGNFGFGALRELSQIPEFVGDSAFSLFSKQSTIAPPGLNIPRGMHAAATKGVKEAAEVLKYGNTLETAKKMDMGYQELNSKVFGGGLADKAINGWVNGNFRALGAEDKLFRSYALQRAIDDGAYATARTMKLQGKLPAGTNVSDYAKEIAANPPKSLTADAMYAADYAVFANKNAVASWINSGKQGNQGLRIGLDLAMPYVTTPTNIFARLIEYTPVGTAVNGTVAAKKILSEGFTAEQQKALSQAIGRGATGSALIWAGYELAKKGLMTGHPSDVAGERGVQMAAGRQPMSLKVGDTYYRINEFTPAAPLLIMGATYYEEAKVKGASLTDAAVAVPGMALKTAEELPLAQGAEILSRAMDNPESFAKSYTREQLGTMVPTIMADVARASDDKVRTSYLKDAGWFDAMKERVPGLRKSLPALQDVYGREVPSVPRHAIDPTLPRKETSDPTAKEMARIGASVTKPRQRIGEPDRDYLLRQEVQGRLVFAGLSQLTKAPEWQRMNDEQKRAAVAHVRSQVGRELSAAPPDVLKKLKERLQ